jgi:membrane dipeptidase
MDGGFGADDIPREIRTSADLPKVGEALGAAGFGDADVEAVMGGNWARFFGDNLARG